MVKKINLPTSCYYQLFHLVLLLIPTPTHVSLKTVMLFGGSLSSPHSLKKHFRFSPAWQPETTNIDVTGNGVGDWRVRGGARTSTQMHIQN